MINIVIVGFIALTAALAGAAGIGGGGFFTPILMIVGGLSIFSAIPISSAIIIGVGLASAYINYKNKTINYKLGLVLEPATIVGTFIGIQLHLQSSKGVILGIFSIFMVILTIKSFLRAKRIHDCTTKEEIKELGLTLNLSTQKILIALIVSVTAGIVSALVGIGGGLIKVPTMNELGLSPILASGTGSFMVLFTSISTAVQFIFCQRLDIFQGIFFFLVGFSASYVGTKYSRKNIRPDLVPYVLTLSIGFSTILSLLWWVYNGR